MTVVAFIPARGGSERVRGKNLRMVGDGALVGHALTVGFQACDRVVVSTDDDTIATLALHAGAELHRRPPELAGPHSQIEDAIAHWLEGESLEAEDVVVLLQPTSPFRRAETVWACIEGAREYGASLTVTPCPEAWFAGAAVSEPTTGVLWDQSRSQARPRSQDMRDVREDGCVYAFTVRHFDRFRLRMLPLFAEHRVVVSRWESFEIDTEADLVAANALAPHIERLIGGEV